MNNEIVFDIARDVMEAKNLIDLKWDKVAVVVDLNDGHFAQSGFIYLADEVEPCTVKTADRKLFSNDCRRLQSSILEETGKTVRQMLIQVERNTGKIKIDFEFDNPARWSIGPGNMKEMREALRPKFD